MSVRSYSFRLSAEALIWCELSAMIQAHRHHNQRRPKRRYRQRVIAAIYTGADMELAARMLSVKIWTVKASD